MIRYFKNKVRLFSNARKEPYLLFANILGFTPKNLELYKQATTHKSAQVKKINGCNLNNERLEFLGDAILGAIISDVLFKKYPNRSEGFLTNTRSKIVKRESLNEIAIKLGLNKLVQLSHHVNIVKNNVYGNAFEALIGAIYLDYGYEKCHKFVQTKVLDVYVDIETLAKKEVNFKSRLIEWSQKNKAEITFELLEDFVNHESKSIFQTQVYINMHPAGLGTGYSKKESQQNASQLAIKKISQWHNFWLEPINRPITSPTNSDISEFSQIQD